MKSLLLFVCIYLASGSQQDLFDALLKASRNHSAHHETVMQIESYLGDPIKQMTFAMHSKEDRDLFAKGLEELADEVNEGGERTPHRFISIDLKVDDGEDGHHSIGIEFHGKTKDSRLYQSWNGVYTMGNWLDETNNFGPDPDSDHFLSYRLARERFGKGKLISKSETERMFQLLMLYMGSFSGEESGDGSGKLPPEILEELEWYNLAAEMWGNDKTDIKLMTPIIIFGVPMEMKFTEVTVRVYDASKFTAPAPSVAVGTDERSESDSGDDDAKHDSAPSRTQIKSIEVSNSSFRFQTNCFRTVEAIERGFAVDPRVNIMLDMEHHREYPEYLSVFTREATGHGFGIELLRGANGDLRARFYQSWHGIFCLVDWMGCRDSFMGADGQPRVNWLRARDQSGGGKLLSKLDTKKLLNLVYMYLALNFAPSREWILKTSYGPALHEVVARYNYITYTEYDMDTALPKMHKILPVILFGVSVSYPAKMQVDFREYGPLEGTLWECT